MQMGGYPNSLLDNLKIGWQLNTCYAYQIETTRQKIQVILSNMLNFWQEYAAVVLL